MTHLTADCESCENGGRWHQRVVWGDSVEGSLLHRVIGRKLHHWKTTHASPYVFKSRVVTPGCSKTLRIWDVEREQIMVSV